MKLENRRKKILDLLSENSEISNSEISELFGITRETVRKDLIYLEKAGLLKRSFGGAILTNSSLLDNRKDDPSTQIRSITNEKEKRALAEFAFKLVEENDTIILDSSTTTLQLAKILPEDKNLVVITNSLTALFELSKKSGIAIISLGGYYRRSSTSFLGKLTLGNLSEFNINKVFMSGNAFSCDKGLMDPNEQEVEFKQAAMQVSEHAILMLDYTKFGKISAFNTAASTSFSDIITNKEYNDATEIKKLNALPGNFHTV